MQRRDGPARAIGDRIGDDDEGCELAVDRGVKRRLRLAPNRAAASAKGPHRRRAPP